MPVRRKANGHFLLVPKLRFLFSLPNRYELASLAVSVSSPPRSRRGLRRGVERSDAPSNGPTQGGENPHLYPLPLRKGEANSPAADAEPIAKLCLGMHSLLRRLKDAATMPHLHGPIYETA